MRTMDAGKSCGGTVKKYNRQNWGDNQNHKLLGDRAKTEILTWAKRRLAERGLVTDRLDVVKVACAMFKHEWMTPDEAWGRLAAAHRNAIQKALKDQVDEDARPADPDFYNSDAWLRLRFEVLAASDGHCSLCGRGKEHGVIIQVDHIQPRSLRPERALDITNLQPMCLDCNKGKGNRDQTDWRSPELKVRFRRQ